FLRPTSKLVKHKMIPDRYDGTWRRSFEDRLLCYLNSDISILDVGSGRRPSVPVERRPASCHYVGLDLSNAELALARPGSYQETWACDITIGLAELRNRFDLAVSWQVLEHVRPLAAAIDNIYSYLKPGGHLVATLSGTFSIFGLLNRIIPIRLGAWTMHRL